MPRDVGAAAGLGDRERADLLAGQRRPDEPVDQVGRAVGRDVRQRDAAGEQRGHQPAGRAGLEHPLLQVDRVEQVAALAADRLGERDAEQTLLRGRQVQLARDLAGVLPLLEVRRHLAPHELARGLPSASRRSAHRSASCDRDDPRAHPLAEALGLRVEPGGRGDAVAEQAADQRR